MVKITWLGHSAFKIESKNLIILIDPWIKGNPVSPLKSYKEIKKADLVLVTHDHSDHGFKDAVKICRRTGATFVGVFELANKAGWKLVKKTVGGNIGGEIDINGIKVYFAPAWHSSKIASPCGFIVKIDDFILYHTGDTGFYSDMEYLGKLYDIDVMMMPICSNVVMGIKEAVWAVEKIKPKRVIPCHYNTMPRLMADPEEFKKTIGNLAEVNIMKVNEIIEL
jgi:L-ascorbate metabolism protein UlaG (beta-lactamase superfamily)